MTIKEQVIHESMKRVRERLGIINEILDASPLVDIINLRQEGQKLLDENVGEKRFAPEFVKKISIMAKREKELFKLAELQKETSELISEKVKLEMEQSSLSSELFFMDKSNFR